MGRRRLVALVSALLMLVIGAVVIGAFAAATQSSRGRDLIRRVVEAQLSRVHRVYPLSARMSVSRFGCVKVILVL